MLSKPSAKNLWHAPTARVDGARKMNPLVSASWLANHLAQEGRGLRAGQIVLTGSLVKTIWLDAGATVTMDLSGLGAVEVRFG